MDIKSIELSKLWPFMGVHLYMIPVILSSKILIYNLNSLNEGSTDREGATGHFIINAYSKIIFGQTYRLGASNI